MTGRKISARIDGETANRLDALARIDSRKPTRIAAEAIDLYVRLPREIHASLRYVLEHGTPEHITSMLREVSRAISNASFDLAIDSAAPGIQEIYGDRLQTEEEIIAESIRLTRRDRPPTVM